MNALRRQSPGTDVLGSPSTQDTRDLLILAGTLRERAGRLLARPEQLRAHARRQLAELRTQQARGGRTAIVPQRGGTAWLNPYRRDPAQTELLGTLSTLRHATDVAGRLRPRIEALIAEIDDLVATSHRAAHPLRMLLSRRSSRDTAQVAAVHLRRFLLALSTLRLAGEIRRSCTELDTWQPDPQSLWQHYRLHAASYDLLLTELTGVTREQERA